MPEEIQERLIEEEMKESYLDYSMSVIVGRALPDAHDGLKPVHRRILYGMHQMGMLHNRPFKKSARVVGEILGKYHPHGDLAVYDALVRMAQDFSLRYRLIDGQGNFGSTEDPPAAMRYTECRLTKVAESLLADINKKTVNFVPNFDNSLKEPIVLPAKIPNLLINGSSGIAVGMATNIPPHNISEVLDGIVSFIDDPHITVEELMGKIKGPDFPTGAFIVGKNEIKKAYSNGRGKIKVRAKVEISKDRIIITEIPYMINKAQLIENIADLVKNKIISGISDIRDESDRKGMRIVIELRKNENGEVILNQLYKHTKLENTFGIIILALVAGEPKILTLRDLINYFIIHRKRVITRRTKFDLEKAEDRAHILMGLKIALTNIDHVVRTIKSSKDVEVAKKLLIQGFKLSEIQAKAILEMRLQKLTSLETSKINKEYESLLKLIEELKSILASEERILKIIKKECLELKEKYGDKRKTEILEDEEELETEDLIPDEDVVITLTKSGYVKKIPIKAYKDQRRGGKGIVATTAKEGDFVEELFVTRTHSHVLFFTDKGRIYWLKAYQIPSGSRYGGGKAIVNLLKLQENENVNAVIPVKDFKKDLYLVMITEKGRVKKTSLKAYSRPRKNGIIGITLDRDKLISVRLTDGKKELIVGTENGLAIRFKESDVRVMGRTARGVIGIRLKKDKVVGMEIVEENESLLTVTENGYGKRTKISEYRLIKRGGKGVINIKTSKRNGKVVEIKSVKDSDEVMLITKKGILIRVKASGISLIGRNTQGVRLMKLGKDDKVIALAKVKD